MTFCRRETRKLTGREWFNKEGESLNNRYERKENYRGKQEKKIIELQSQEESGHQ